MSFASQLTIAIVAAMTPTIAVLIGIFLQRQDTRDLRAEMKELRGDVRGELDSFRTEMIVFRQNIHEDMLLIHERVAKIEARQGQ